MLYEANLLEPRPMGNDGGLMGDDYPLTWQEALFGTSPWTLVIPTVLLIVSIVAITYATQLRIRLAALGYSWPRREEAE
jgi:hypothetical protein